MKSKGAPMSPIEVISIQGPRYIASSRYEDRKIEDVAEEIKSCYEDVQNRNGKILGTHALHGTYRGSETDLTETTLYVVADIPEQPDSEEEQIRRARGNSGHLDS